MTRTISAARIISMARANLRMLFRARQALFWNLAFPLIILGLFSVIFGKNGSGFSATVGVVGKGPVAVAAERALESVKGVTVKTGGTQAAEIAALKKGDRDAVLLVPPGLPAAKAPLP